VTIRGFVAVESICVEFKETPFQIEYREIWHERQRRHSALGSEPGDPRAYFPGRRPFVPRIERGGGLARPSADGGVQEFPEFLPALRLNSEFSAPADPPGLRPLPASP
jgi:hypothetical protein